MANKLHLSFLFSSSSLLLFTLALSAQETVPVISVGSTDQIQIEQRLNKIERLLQSDSLLDMLQQMDTLQQEISRLNGEIEVNTHKLQQISKKQHDLYTDTDRRLRRIEESAVADRSVGSSNHNATGSSIVTTAGDQTEEAVDETVADNNTVAVAGPNQVQLQDEYQQAFALLKQSKYDQAIKAFGNFLQIHPTNEYSDNAQYWVAEALYVKRQYENAITEYKKLIDNYPDSLKIAQSLLKVGYSYQEIGKTDLAKHWYVDVKKRFPGTTSSRLAEERLKRVNDL